MNVANFARDHSSANNPGVPDHLTELRAIATRLDDIATQDTSEEVEGPLRKVMEAAGEVGKAWSGSNLGFHSRVYYDGLQPPPPGAHFDAEWGFRGTFQGTTGDWAEFVFDDVVKAIYEDAGVNNLDAQADLATEARKTTETTKPEVVSVLRAWLTRQDDPLVEELCDQASKVDPMTEATALKAFVARGGTKITRDSTAVSEGWHAAPHQAVEARAVAIRSSFQSCASLSQIATRAAAHIDRLETSQQARGQEPVAAGQNVFIGHGQSAQWRELKDFISDRLKLAWDEFNRIPVAGVTNIARLSEMLDDAGIAFLILTAEDEMTGGGKDRARQNVVHEAGLFQGRLGFTRAIVMLEAECEEFSNIQGLGQIRFPDGNIGASFEEVRRVLEREGFIPG